VGEALTAAPLPPAAAGRPGAILLTRHGEPALSRRVKLDAEGYRRWWALYEEGGLLGGQTPPPRLLESASSAIVVCSTRRRSLETAQALSPGAFTPEPVLIEAPLPPPRLPSVFKFSPRTWGVISRLSWWLGHHQGEESRLAAEARARRAADRLIELAQGGQDVLVLAHGYFNAMVGFELKRRGWRLVSDPGYGYWCARRFERN